MQQLNAFQNDVTDLLVPATAYPSSLLSEAERALFRLASETASMVGPALKAPEEAMKNGVLLYDAWLADNELSLRALASHYAAFGGCAL